MEWAEVQIQNREGQRQAVQGLGRAMGLGRPGGRAAGLSRGGACDWSPALSWWPVPKRSKTPHCHFRLHLDLWEAFSVFPRPLCKLLAATLLSRSV